MDADAALVLLTGFSVIIAAIAASIAVAANKEAARAQKLAQEANTLAGRANTLSAESNSISREATAHATGIATDIAWDEAISAVAAIQTFDAAGQEPLGDRMAVIRTRLMLLIDRLDWDGFDSWIARELQCINVLARDADAKGRAAGSQVRNPVIALALNKDLLTWISGFTTNLRYMRKTGPEQRMLTFLEGRAVERARQVAALNGWEPPPDKVEGLEPVSISDLTP